MNKIQKLLTVGDYVYSANNGKPMRVISIGSTGFSTEEYRFSYDDVRLLFFLTKRGYIESRGRNKN